MLSSLDAIYVNADWRTVGVDEARLDNVVLAANVPEPASAALCLGGLPAVAAAARRRRRAGGPAA